jgi:hypothetical protein
MNVISAFVANSEASELVQPSDCSFHDPAMLTQSTSMFGVPASQARSNAAATQRVAMRLRVVTAVALNALRSVAWSASLAGNRRNGFHQRQQLRHIVEIGAGERGCQRNARRIRDDMVLAPRLAAICGVSAGFCPPSTALTLELSTTARDQSIRSDALSLSSRSWCNRFQTPASCQSRSRRQQLIPQPQPISWGSIDHGMPVRSTNKMPVSASRLPIGGRPPLGDDTIGGRSGSTNSHSSSDTSTLAMTVLLEQASDGQTTSS